MNKPETTPPTYFHHLRDGTVSTATAMLFGAPHGIVGRGLYGFNGTLTGIALASYLRHDPLLPAYVAVASAFAAVATAAVKDAFGAQGHALTAPFVLTTWFFVAARFDSSRLGAAVPGAPHLPTDAAAAFGPADAVTGFLNGLAQVMLQQSVWTGVIFLVALVAASRTVCMAAALGSAFGLCVAWVAGAAPDTARNGLYGFNAALTAIAVGGTFYRLDRASVLLAVLAACVSTVLYAAMGATLGRAGLPVLTAPFVLTTWLCLLAGPALARLRPVPEQDAVPRKGGPPCPKR